MYSCSYYFEPNFIEKFHWESGFSNFGQVTIFAKRKCFLAAIFKRKIFWMFFFADLWLFLGVYRYGASFVPKFLR